MNRQIVVVDDESDILAIVAEALRTDGHTPVVFSSSIQALAYMRERCPALLLTDLLMPLLSGQELVMKVREECSPGMPIIVMSASVNLASVTSLPIQAFLSKPFDLDDLSDLVMRLLEPH